MNCLFPLQKETTLVQLIKKKNKKSLSSLCKNHVHVADLKSAEEQTRNSAFGNVWQPTSGGKKIIIKTY